MLPLGCFTARMLEKIVEKRRGAPRKQKGAPAVAIAKIALLFLIVSVLGPTRLLIVHSLVRLPENRLDLLCVHPVGERIAVGDINSVGVGRVVLLNLFFKGFQSSLNLFLCPS